MLHCPLADLGRCKQYPYKVCRMRGTWRGQSALDSVDGISTVVSEGNECLHQRSEACQSSFLPMPRKHRLTCTPSVSPTVHS